MADLQFVHFALMPDHARPSEERKAIQPTYEFGFYYSLMDEPFRVRFSRAFWSFHNTD